MARFTIAIPVMITLSLLLTLVSARNINMDTTQATTTSEKAVGITDEKNVNLGLGGFGGLGAAIGLGKLGGLGLSATGGLGLGLDGGNEGVGGLGGGVGGVLP